MVTVLVPPDPRWRHSFVEEASALRSAFGPAVTDIEHIGSTAIPCLLAKPIVDMLGIASSLGGVDDRAGALVALGYEVMGEYGIAGRRYFRKSNDSGVRTHHLHVFETGRSEIRRHLAFRDYLRACPQVAYDYSALKASLAMSDDYQQRKSPYVRRVTAAALRWKRERGER